MAYCRYCGKKLAEHASFCSECGAKVLTEAPPPPPYTAAPPPSREVDSRSIGWWFLGFFFPTIGFILYLVWRKDAPMKARRCGIGALTSVIAFVLFYVAVIAFAIIMAILTAMAV